MINKDKYYNANDIAIREYFPWIKHERTILKWIQSQVRIGNQHKYNIIVKNSDIDSVKAKFGKRYYIKGEGIIKIITAFEDGTLNER